MLLYGRNQYNIVKIKKQKKLRDLSWSPSFPASDEKQEKQSSDDLSILLLVVVFSH